MCLGPSPDNDCDKRKSAEAAGVGAGSPQKSKQCFMTQDDLATQCSEFRTPSAGILAIRNLSTRILDLLLRTFLIAVMVA